MVVMMQWDKGWREEDVNSRDDKVSVNTPGWGCWRDIPEKIDHLTVRWR